MLATAVPGDVAVWWWSALAVGLVVAIVVLLLLHSLLRLVKGIEAGLAAVWETGKQTARNTATTWMLGQTARLLEEIKAEALEHNALLDRKGSGSA